MAIKYDKNLNNEINRIVRNYNRKVARLENKNYKYIPNRISIRKLKNDNQTRRELRRELNKLKRFSKRGSEEIITTKKGLNITKWEYDTLKVDRQRAFRELNKELKRVEEKKPKVLGKVQSVTMAQMGSSEYTNLIAKKKVLSRKNVDLMSRDELSRYKKLLRQLNKSDESLGIKENMIEVIEKNGYLVGVERDKLNKIVDNLNSVPYKNFKDLIEDEKAVKIMFDYYSLLKIPTFNPKNVDDDLLMLFDNLAESIEEIIKNYL